MIDEDIVQQVSASRYSAALRRVPPNKLGAREQEELEGTGATHDPLVRSARVAVIVTRRASSRAAAPASEGRED